MKYDKEYEYTCCTAGAGFTEEACVNCCEYKELILIQIIGWLCYWTCFSTIWLVLWGARVFRAPVQTKNHELWMACFESDDKQVKELISEAEALNIDVNYSDPMGTWDFRRLWGAPPLVVASFVSKSESVVVEMLLTAKADVNKPNLWGFTPLHLAAFTYGNTEIVTMLLDAKADMAQQSWFGQTALGLAQGSGHTMASRILSNTAAERALLLAAESNDDVAAAAVFKAHGTELNDVDSTTRPGQTALYHFAKHNNLQGAKLLYGEKKMSAQAANVSIQDEDGKTALHWAAEHGNVKMSASLLLEPEIHVDQITTAEGISPLHLAASKGSLEICRMLLDADADIDLTSNMNVRGEGNRTAMHMAAAAGHPNVCELLIEHNTWSHARDQMQKTPLDLAKTDTVRTVVKTDYDKEIDGETQLVCEAIGDENDGRKRIMRYPNIVCVLLLLSVGAPSLETDFDWILTFELLGATAATSERPDMDIYLGQVSLCILCTANFMTAAFMLWWDCKNPESARFSLNYFETNEFFRILGGITAGNMCFAVVGSLIGFGCWIASEGAGRSSDMALYWAMPGILLGAPISFTVGAFVIGVGYGSLLNNLPSFFLSLTGLRLPVMAALDGYQIITKGLQPDNIRDSTSKVWERILVGSSGVALLKVLELLFEVIPELLLKAYVMGYKGVVLGESLSTILVLSSMVGCYSAAYSIGSTYFCSEKFKPKVLVSLFMGNMCIARFAVHVALFIDLGTDSVWIMLAFAMVRYVSVSQRYRSWFLRQYPGAVSWSVYQYFIVPVGSIDVALTYFFPVETDDEVKGRLDHSQYNLILAVTGPLQKATVKDKMLSPRALILILIHILESIIGWVACLIYDAGSSQTDNRTNVEVWYALVWGLCPTCIALVILALLSKTATRGRLGGAVGATVAVEATAVVGMATTAATGGDSGGGLLDAL